MRSLFNIMLLYTLAFIVAFSGRHSDRHAGFRVRSAFDVPLNSPRGWAGTLGENVTVYADEPFRIRFEIESNAASVKSSAHSFYLEVRRNGKEWERLEAHDFPHPQSKTPRVSLVSCAAYKSGEATKNLLKGSSTPFRPGVGVGLSDTTESWNGANGHGEFEWAVVIRRFADGAVTNEPGDTFEFRVTTKDGSPLDGAPYPSLRLALRPGHIGGTYVETPGRIGPFQASNGDLYFIMEPAETNNVFMMMKSRDQGRTWEEVDGANRPPTRDLESVDARHSGDTIHIVHQVTRSTHYHSFRTSDHERQPDTWAIRGEKIGSVKSIAQATTLAIRSDESIVAFYVGKTKVHFSVRDTRGKWSQMGVIESALSPQCVRGAGDVIHLAYYSPDGCLWYRSLAPDGSLSDAKRFASGLKESRSAYGSVLPMLYHAKSDTAIIVYRAGDGMLWERRVNGEGNISPAVRATDRRVIQDAVDSQQPAADIVLDGDTVHLLFVDSRSRSVYSTHNKGGWQRGKLLVDGIRGSWIRGSVYARQNHRRLLGFVYDAGSDGGAGMNRFSEIDLNKR